MRWQMFWKRSSGLTFPYSVISIPVFNTNWCTHNSCSQSVSARFALQSPSVFPAEWIACMKSNISPADLPWNGVLVWDYAALASVSLMEAWPKGRKRGRVWSTYSYFCCSSLLHSQSTVQFGQTLQWRQTFMETQIHSIHTQALNYKCMVLNREQVCTMWKHRKEEGLES